MKPFIYKALSLGVAVLALSSCNDFLDQNPDERVDIDTEKKVVELLSSGYSNANYGYLCELSSDNIIDNNSPHRPADPDSKVSSVYYNLAPYERMDNEVFAFEPVQSSTSTDSPSLVWQGCYNAIATANHALQAMDEIVAKNGGEWTQSLRAARAEALLIRAYHHFILVNVFCQAYKNPELSKQDIGVPYITTVENTVHPHYDRGNVADVYDSIRVDLEAGLADISDINYSKPKWHFNVNAAHAFAARFYLFTRDYDKVIEHADAVLGVGTGNLPNMLMKYDGFDGCTYSDDYANVWQSPNAANNLMLIATNSVMWRRFLGYRYTHNGDALRSTYYRTGPNWRWYVIPCGYVSGMTFYSGEQDYGYESAKIAERFEYTDKVAGVGYPHVIRREFTATELLLERAEAKLLSQDRQDIPGAVADLIAFDDSRQTFTAADKQRFEAQGALVPLTESLILSYYSNTNNPNCFENWDFTQRMSPDFIVPANAVPYMNCINDMRRFETVFDGLRFFDLKRFGIEYSHSIGNPAVVETLTWDDPRRAIEVPQEVLAAGLESSRPLANDDIKQDVNYRVKTDK